MRFSASCVFVSVLCATAQAQSTAYLVDSDLDQLFSVDLTSGQATFIASTANNGLTSPADLTWKDDTGDLWTIDLDGGEVGTIDTTTGTFTPVYQTNITGWQGMAWDQATGMFYLMNQDNNTHVLHPGTGVTTHLANSTQNAIGCLDVDAGGTLYGFGFFTGNWCMVDKGTGIAAAIATILSAFQGLSYDSASNTWYATNSNDDSLYSVDPTTGVATLIGSHGGVVDFAKGFEVAVGSTVLTPFCTAKTTSMCGAASISASGVSSATATSGFVVSAAPTRGCRSGLLLYSNQPIVPGVPFGGPGDGLLCLTPAGLRRAGPIESGGTAPSVCDGVMAIDLNSFRSLTWAASGCAPPLGQTNPAGFLGNMGTVVTTQVWGRDSVSTGQVLSDGLSFTVGP